MKNLSLVKSITLLVIIGIAVYAILHFSERDTASDTGIEVIVRHSSEITDHTLLLPDTSTTTIRKVMRMQRENKLPTLKAISKNVGSNSVYLSPLDPACRITQTGSIAELTNKFTVSCTGRRYEIQPRSVLSSIGLEPVGNFALLTLRVDSWLNSKAVLFTIYTDGEPSDYGQLLCELPLQRCIFLGANIHVPVNSNDDDLEFQTELHNSDVYKNAPWKPSILSSVDSELPQQVIDFHTTTDYSKTGSIDFVLASPNNKYVLYEYNYNSLYARSKSQNTNFRGFREIYLYEIDSQYPERIIKSFDFKENSEDAFHSNYWISDTEILISLEGIGVPNPAGVFVYNIKTKKIRQLPIHPRYTGTPRLINNGTQLEYSVLRGTEPVNIDWMMEKTDTYIFDLATHKNFKVTED